jgi:hypothetical protein
VTDEPFRATGKRFVLKPRFAIMVLVIAVIAAVLLVTESRPRFTDSDLVYCLSDHEEQRSQLVGAAIALGLAEDTSTADSMRIGGQEITPKQWWSTHRNDFERACLALNPPQQLNFLEQIVSAESGLVGILAALIGGAAYYFAERARDRSQRRGDDARRLNDLSTAFVAEVENYARQRSAAIPGRPDVDPIRTYRNKLVSELQMVRARHRGWAAPDEPLEMLRGVLSDELTGGWGNPSQRADTLMAALAQLAEQIGSIAVELERGRPQSTAASR